MPEGKTIKFVPLNNKWMQAARKECDTNGNCSWWPTGAVIVKGNKIISRGANKGVYNAICPRVEQQCPSGTGYELCTRHCKQTGHAEKNAILAAERENYDLTGADMYLFGHWWCCQSCWESILRHDFGEIYLLENAHKIFTKEARLTAHKIREEQIKDGITPTADQARWIIK